MPLITAVGASMTGRPRCIPNEALGCACTLRLILARCHGVNSKAVSWQLLMRIQAMERYAWLRQWSAGRRRPEGRGCLGGSFPFTVGWGVRGGGLARPGAAGEV